MNRKFMKCTSIVLALSAVNVGAQRQSEPAQNGPRQEERKPTDASSEFATSHVRKDREIPDPISTLVVNDARDLKDHASYLEAITFEADGGSLRIGSQPTHIGDSIRYVAHRYLDNIPTMEAVFIEVDSESKNIVSISSGDKHQYKREKKPSMSQDQAMEIVLDEIRNSKDARDFKVEEASNYAELIYVLKPSETRDQVIYRLWWRVWIERNGSPIYGLSDDEPFATHQFWYVDPEGEIQLL